MFILLAHSFVSKDRSSGKAFLMLMPKVNGIILGKTIKRVSRLWYL